MTPETEITGRLENWKECSAMYTSSKCIYGNIYEDVHGRWKPGTAIFTSKLQNQKRKPKEGDLVKTLNSTYLLGVPAEEIKDKSKETDK